MNHRTPDPPDLAQPLPRERLGDQGVLGAIRAFWHDWGGLITGVWLIIVSIAVFVVAVAFVRKTNATDRVARVSCERVLVFGPALADAYSRYKILTPAQVTAYRATIPTWCPR